MAKFCVLLRNTITLMYAASAVACSSEPLESDDSSQDELSTAMTSSSDTSDLESVTVVSTCTVPTIPTTSEVNLDYNRRYSVANGLAMDIAYPKTPGPHPVVVLVHGGSWYGGTKSLLFNEAMLLAGQGYVAATIDYRLSNPSKGGFHSPSEQSDVRCAIRYLRANASVYGADATRVGLVGNSAGGHLVASVQTEGSELDDGTCETPGDASVLATVGYYGIYDLRPGVVIGGALTTQRVDDFLGCARAACPSMAALASPLAHLDDPKADGPFLLTAGTADTIVDYGQSTAMLSAAHAAGVKATLVTIPGEDHNYGIFATHETLPASCTTLAFLKAYLNP